MLAQLIAGLPAGARLTDMVAFPPGFRAWVQVQLTGGIGGEVDRGSDRVWDYDPTGAWHMSVQSVDAAGQLQTRLPDRPMAGTVLVYDDIQYHWHLSKTAYSESDCVARSLAEALELEVETCKERLEQAADGQDTSQGYTCAMIKEFFEDHTNRTGKEVGWKIFRGSEVDETPRKDKGPFIAFTQRANHLYLYKKACTALNNTHTKKPRAAFVDLREFTRDLSCIPYELRTRVSSTAPHLGLWQLKAERRENGDDWEIVDYEGIKPGHFFTSDLQSVHWGMLNQGFVPTVRMKNCMEAQSLSLRLSATESCLVRQYPEDFFRLKHLAKDLQLPYRGQGTAAFAHQAIVALLRRKKETTTIAEGCCYLCGGEAEEIDHTPQQARSTEKTDEKPICRTCHEAKSAEDARWDDGWRPFVSVLNPHTWEGYQLQPRERPFNLIASKPQQKAYVELDLKKADRHALTHPMDGWCVFFAYRFLDGAHVRTGALELGRGPRGEGATGKRLSGQGVVSSAFAPLLAPRRPRLLK